MEKTIKKHNSKVGSSQNEDNKDCCNSYVKNDCPLLDRRRSNNVVYKGTLSAPNKHEKIVYRLASGELIWK